MTPHTTSAPTEIADIAQLFLSQTRANTSPGRPRPVRIPPSRILPTPQPLSIDPACNAETQPSTPRVTGVPPMPAQPPSAPADTFRDNTPPDTTPLLHAAHSTRPQHSALSTQRSPLPPIHLLIAPHISPERLPTFAGQVAAALHPTGRMGLLIPGSGLYLLDAHLPIDHTTIETATTEKDLAEHVIELTPEVDGWLIASTNLDTDWELLARATEWIIPADTNSQPTTIAAYATLKSLAALAETPIRLATLGDPTKLAQTSAQFLSRPLGGATIALTSESPALHPLLTYTQDLRQTALSLFTETASPKSSTQEEVGYTQPIAAILPVKSLTHEPPFSTAHSAPPQHSALSTQHSEVLDLQDSLLTTLLSSHPEWTEIDYPLDPTTRLIRTPGNSNGLTLVATATTLDDLTTLAQRLTWLVTAAPLLARMTSTREQPVQTLLYLDHTLLYLKPLLNLSIEIIPTRQITWHNEQGLLLPPRQAA